MMFEIEIAPTGRPRRVVDVDRRRACIEELRRVGDPARALASPQAASPASAPVRRTVARSLPRENPKKLIDWFDRVVVVNLDRRPDRWAAFQEHIESIDWPFRKPERFRAVDGRSVKPPGWFKCGGGAWGCLQSHVRILETAMMDGLQSILVLEDDALFVEDLRARAQRFLDAVPTNWHQIYLGGQHLRQGQRPPVLVNEAVLRPYNVNRTHAFAVHKSFFVPMYRWLTNYPEHSRHPRHHVDHRLGELHQTGRFNIYTPSRWLAGQAESHSNIKGQVMPTRYWNRHRVTDDSMPFVAVIGLHRSGSSCMAGVLHKLGVYMGDRLGGYEPSGGFEARGLARLCERAYPFPTTTRSMDDEVLGNAMARHVAGVRASGLNRGCQAVGGKYPHLAAMGDVLTRVVGDSLRVIHIDRPLEESVASLQARSRKASGWLAVSDEQAEAVQRFLWDRKRELLARVEHLTVRYHDLVDDPAREVERIVDFLGIDPDPRARAAAVAHVAGRPVSAMRPGNASERR